MLLHKNKKTIGIRWSSNFFIQALLNILDVPIMSVSLSLDDKEILNSEDICKAIDGCKINLLDLLIDVGYCPVNITTIIDMSTNNIEVVRVGSNCDKDLLKNFLVD